MDQVSFLNLLGDQDELLSKALDCDDELLIGLRRAATGHDLLLAVTFSVQQFFTNVAIVVAGHRG